jgi:hypothetical protein
VQGFYTSFPSRKLGHPLIEYAYPHSSLTSRKSPASLKDWSG